MAPSTRTYVAKPTDRERNWLVVDANGKTLGRMATQIADALRGKRTFDSILGLCYKDSFGFHRTNPERPMKGPDEFPWSPFHRLPVEKYLRPSFFGKRTAAHHASIGCPFRCSFCGVHAVYGNRELVESTARTEAILRHLKEKYGADSVQFYDMNFFVRESHARDLAERMESLGFRWWCEARIDTFTRYSDATLEAIRRAGCAMIFFGAESGSDWVLKEMQKDITTEQTLAVAQRIRQFGIIPEFSFVIGNPRDPERDTRETLEFIRKLKRINRQRYEQMRDRFGKQEFLAIMIPAMMPPPTPVKLFEFAAGVFEMKLFWFFSAIFVGKFIRFLIWALITITYGPAILHTIIRTIHQHLSYVLGFSGILIVLLLVYVLRKVFDQRRGTSLPVEEN